MKKTKIIVPALGMLLLSTAASVTGTVAWFAVNTSVTVTNLSVQAKAEGGIVIAPYTFVGSSISKSGEYYDGKVDASYTAPTGGFNDKAEAAFGSTAVLYPTSTGNATAWYHATSSAVDSHAATAGSYTQLSNLKLDGKVISGNGQTAATEYKLEGQYFLHAKYKVRSTTTNDNFNLFLRTITISGEQDSGNLNDSLRIAVKAGDAAVQFFAPTRTAEPEGGFKAYQGANLGNTEAPLPAPEALTVTYGTSPNVQISANNAVVYAGIDLDIWVYYEGEDPECKTSNTEGITIDELDIEMAFWTTAAA